MKCVGPDGNPGVAMHSHIKLNGKGDEKTRVPCYFQYHNTAFFGLARSDFALKHGNKKKDWKPPTEEECDINRELVRSVIQSRPAAPIPTPAVPAVDHGEVNWSHVV